MVLVFELQISLLAALFGLSHPSVGADALIIFDWGRPFLFKMQVPFRLRQSGFLINPIVLSAGGLRFQRKWDAYYSLPGLVQPSNNDEI